MTAFFFQETYYRRKIDADCDISFEKSLVASYSQCVCSYAVLIGFSTKYSRLLLFYSPADYICDFCYTRIGYEVFFWIIFLHEYYIFYTNTKTNSVNHRQRQHVLDYFSNSPLADSYKKQKTNYSFSKLHFVYVNVVVFRQNAQVNTTVLTVCFNNCQPFNHRHHRGLFLSQFPSGYVLEPNNVCNDTVAAAVTHPNIQVR